MAESHVIKEDYAAKQPEDHTLKAAREPYENPRESILG